jgi:hypothetical protein
MKFSVQCCLLFVITATVSHAADRLVFEAKGSNDTAKHIVLVSGDEEYRTEESLPMLGKILSQKHGWCGIHRFE